MVDDVEEGRIDGGQKVGEEQEDVSPSPSNKEAAESMLGLSFLSRGTNTSNQSPSADGETYCDKTSMRIEFEDSGCEASFSQEEVEEENGKLLIPMHDLSILIAITNFRGRWTQWR